MVPVEVGDTVQMHVMLICPKLKCFKCQKFGHILQIAREKERKGVIKGKGKQKGKKGKGKGKGFARKEKMNEVGYDEEWDSADMWWHDDGSWWEDQSWYETAQVWNDSWNESWIARGKKDRRIGTNLGVGL